MKKIILLPLFAMTLCSCQYNPKYCVGEWADVHEHYQAIIVSEPTRTSSITYIDKNGEQQIEEKNGITFVQLDLKIKRDRAVSKGHKLDCDDFKLSDRIGTIRGGLKDEKAYEDYRWVGKEIQPDEEYSFTIALPANSDKIDGYDHLEIDFSWDGGNATFIYLKTREAK